MILLTFWSKLPDDALGGMLVNTRDADKYCGPSLLAFNEKSTEIYKTPNLTIGIYPDEVSPPVAAEYSGALLLAAGEDINAAPVRLASNRAWIESRGYSAADTADLLAFFDGRSVGQCVSDVGHWMVTP